jgi:hypothetical protein
VSEQLSWAQHLILSAAVKVNYLPLHVRHQINVPYGVWRSLVLRGLLQPHPLGWEITERGQKLIEKKEIVVVSLAPRVQQKERLFTMDGKLPRYRVARTQAGWAVIDRSKNKITMHSDVVETLRNREAARIRVRELNRLERITTTGDAA